MSSHNNKNKKPLISVIMPVYNVEAFVSEAIDSILNQTYTDFEFIIIDDASTDDHTWDIVRSYTDKRIICLQNEVNSGPLCGLGAGLIYLLRSGLVKGDEDEVFMDCEYRDINGSKIKK